MRVILHILTRPSDSLAFEIIERQRELEQTTIRVIDLTQNEPNYDELLDSIFEADSVAAW